LESENKEESIDKIVKTLTRTQNPFTLLKDPLFVELINKAHPEMSLNRRKYFATEILPRVSDEIIEHISGQISSGTFAISISPDNNAYPVFYRYSFYL
jgi:hypothetical protein